MSDIISREEALQQARKWSESKLICFSVPGKIIMKHMVAAIDERDEKIAKLEEVLSDIEDLAEHQEYSLDDMCYQIRHLCSQAFSKGEAAKTVSVNRERFEALERLYEATKVFHRAVRSEIATTPIMMANMAIQSTLAELEALPDA